MPNLIDIRRRIRSVKSTQQITKAMKMVAASKLRRSQERVIAARPYAATLGATLASVTGRVPPREDGAPAHPLLAQREEKKVVLVVVTGDKGLCGAFNTNVNRAAGAFVREKKKAGRRGLPRDARPQGDRLLEAPDASRSSRRGPASSSASTTRPPPRSPAPSRPASPGAKSTRSTSSSTSSRASSRRSSASKRLLPIELGELEAGGAGTDYLYEPAPDVILGRLLPRHVEFQLFRVLLESNAAENAARMTAMESATKNAGEMIDSLTLTYNRARQAKITKELIEIVSGAEALK